jgi:two-component sensor histidine kinase
VVSILTEPLARNNEAAAAARSLVRDGCRDLDSELRCDLLLVVSELVTNAVVHGAEPITLSLDLGEVITVVVADGGSGGPQVSTLDGWAAPGGRGLVLVAALVSDWGVRPDGARGKEVWATILRSG